MTGARHSFEPARLLLGILLIAAGVLYVLDAVGETAIRTAVLLALVPAALVMGALVSLATLGVRRAVRRRRTEAVGASGERASGEGASRGGGPGGDGFAEEVELRDLPVGELRDGYAWIRMGERELPSGTVSEPEPEPDPGAEPEPDADPGAEPDSGGTGMRGSG